MTPRQITARLKVFEKKLAEIELAISSNQGTFESLTTLRATRLLLQTEVEALKAMAIASQ